MRFDDRLKTVLDTPVADQRDRAVRWRQLVDLLSRARADADGDLIDRALAVAAEDRGTVPDEVRAATARSIAGRPLAPRLIALFAADRLEVAAPLLAGTTFDAATRAEVAAVASEDVRRLFFALEGTDLPSSPAPKPPVVPAEAGEIPSISDVVERIETLRRSRESASATPATEMPPPELTNGPALFRWESDPSGVIAWVEGAPRAALIGRTLAGQGGEALLDEECRSMLARRAPFVDLPLLPGEPFQGDWRVSGAPAFSPAEGRFIGYRGVARRLDVPVVPRVPAAAAAPREGPTANADSLRELVHEIKTPLNAIIGFAEIIDGQFLGPAHRRYRERAAGIVEQARQLLAAVEDLDLAAKLQSKAAFDGAGTEFSEIFPKIADELNLYGAPRGVGIVYRLEGTFHRCALPPEMAERLVRRFLRALMDNASEGESIAVEVAPIRGQCGVAVTRPKSLRNLTEDEMVDPNFTGAAGAAQLGFGFALRLVRGLVRIAGGDLVIDTDRFTLMVPAHK